MRMCEYPVRIIRPFSCGQLNLRCFEFVLGSTTSSAVAANIRATEFMRRSLATILRSNKYDVRTLIN